MGALAVHQNNSTVLPPVKVLISVSRERGWLMDSTLVGSIGKTYHLLPQERWIARRIVARWERIDSPKGILRRNGLASANLRAGAVGDAMIAAPLSIALLIATDVVATHHPANATPFIINILIYFVLAGPFVFLQYRRRLQSMRETRAYRANELVGTVAGDSGTEDD